MATYRQIKPSIWSDPDFTEYTPDQKLLFIYLFTNKSITESGIYPISIRTISIDTGLSKEIITQSLKEIKNIIYDFENKCIFVVNFRKHSTIGGNPTLMEKSIRNSFIATMKSPLWHSFLEEYPQYEKVINNGNLPAEQIKGSQTVDKQLAKG